MRSIEVTLDDVIFKARFIFGCDPYKDKAPATEEKKFRALFGCSPVVFLRLWELLNEHELVPEGGKLIHLYWAMIFVKVYPTEETLVKLCCDPTFKQPPDRKTTRKWIRLFLQAISYLSDVVVRMQENDDDDDTAVSHHHSFLIFLRHRLISIIV